MGPFFCTFGFVFHIDQRGLYGRLPNVPHGGTITIIGAFNGGFGRQVSGFQVCFTGVLGGLFHPIDVYMVVIGGGLGGREGDRGFFTYGLYMVFFFGPLFGFLGGLLYFRGFPSVGSLGF